MQPARHGWAEGKDLVHISPLHDPADPDVDLVFSRLTTDLGYITNGMRALAHRPQLLRATNDLTRMAMRSSPGLPASLRQLIASVASSTGACAYCEAHAADAAIRCGAPERKIAEIRSFETSDAFTERERLALRFAAAASTAPPTVTEKHYRDLEQYYSEGEIVEILMVVCVLGLLNRWNSAVATTLEPQPDAVATRLLSSQGWQPGAHGAPESPGAATP
jgi:uncharacterized peroxidase-related enzyme